MTNFEQDFKTAAEKAVLAFIQSGNWIQPSYESRLKIPTTWVNECWNLIDPEKLKRNLAERLESELVDKMVNMMTAEIATDIKQILSVKERRENLRAIAREHIETIMKPENKG